MEEKIFFNKSGVIVSNSRFVVRGQTYAMSGITSIESLKNDPIRIGPIILIFLAIVVLFLAFVNILDSPEVQQIRDRNQPGIVFWEFFFGIILIISGVKWWRGQKTIYEIILNSSSGRTLALTSDDGQFIDVVTTALNDAIVSRG